MWRRRPSLREENLIDEVEGNLNPDPLSPPLSREGRGRS
jgi:hypothetical protein